jgi:O-acetyl-ADP-ribose deacetylase (regulator of RNase III)
MKNTPGENGQKSEPSRLPGRITLVDHSPALVEQWRSAFADCDGGDGPAVEILAGDYFQRPADAIVSPANSFGIMDGGLDLAIRNELGFTVESRVQDAIVRKYHGELPVGSAEIVETGDRRWPHLVAAPTMRVPMPIGFTFNAYLAFRAVLVAIKNFNRAAERQAIDSVVCCGLGTGVGKLEPKKCAGQMRAAYQAMTGPAEIPSFREIHAFHAALVTL